MAESSRWRQCISCVDFFRSRFGIEFTVLLAQICRGQIFSEKSKWLKNQDGGGVYLVKTKSQERREICSLFLRICIHKISEFNS
jgi:hypothetical protein